MTLSTIVYLIAAPILVTRKPSIDLSPLATPILYLLLTAWGSWFGVYQKEVSLARKNYLDAKMRGERRYGQQDDWELDEDQGNRGMRLVSRMPEVLASGAATMVREAFSEDTRERYHQYLKQQRRAKTEGDAKHA